jgi:protein gp37
MTRRLQAMGQKKYAAGFDKVVCHEDALREPFAWKKPRRIFVNSMSDTFHKDVSDDFIDKIIVTAVKLQQHRFMFLTKRAQRMYEYVCGLKQRMGYTHWPPSNIYHGVTVENQDQLGRIEWLRKTPAAVRFISFEPLIGFIPSDKYSLNGIHWVIVGSETGPGARRMKLDWAERLRYKCLEMNIPFFFKKSSKGDAIPACLDVHEFPKADK